MKINIFTHGVSSWLGVAHRLAADQDTYIHTFHRTQYIYPFTQRAIGRNTANHWCEANYI